MPTRSRSRSGKTPAPEPPAAPLAPERARIARLALDDKLGARRFPEVEQERTVAIHDLLEENRFALVDGPPGPYDVELGIDSNRLIFNVRDEDGRPLRAFGLALGPFRRLVMDYFRVCESYYDAIKRRSPSQIEAIDMGRRALHDEGSELLRRRLDGKADLDFGTARRLFTLLCVLHLRP